MVIDYDFFGTGTCAKKYNLILKFQLSPPYACGIIPKHVTGNGAHLRHFALGQHSSREMLQQWRIFCNTVPNLNSPVTELRPLAPIVMSLATAPILVSKII